MGWWVLTTWEMGKRVSYAKFGNRIHQRQRECTLPWQGSWSASDQVLNEGRQIGAFAKTRECRAKNVREFTVGTDRHEQKACRIDRLQHVAVIFYVCATWVSVPETTDHVKSHITAGDIWLFGMIKREQGVARVLWPLLALRQDNRKCCWYMIWYDTRWFKYDRGWFVCKQAALRSSCATLREWSQNIYPSSCSG